MRVITLNMNGIRSAYGKGAWKWLLSQGADIICLQEVRASRGDIPPECHSEAAAMGYVSFFCPAEKPGYSGVAILSKKEPDDVRLGLQWKEFDAEGRFIAADFGPLTVVSAYVPSGSSGEQRQAFKMEVLARLTDYLRPFGAAAPLKSSRQLLLCGDINIVHREIDIKNWKSNLKNSGCLPEERAWLDEVFGSLGLIDAFRVVNRESEQYTWWSNRGGAYARNVGWRIDYHIASPGITPVAASIFKDVKFSDHAPLTIDYSLPGKIKAE